MDKFDEEAYRRWRDMMEYKHDILPDWYKNEQQRRQQFIDDNKRIPNGTIRTKYINFIRNFIRQ